MDGEPRDPGAGAPPATMLTVAAATRLVLDQLAPLPATRVPLPEARGRILAATAIAPGPLPAFANSAMDGYAARSADLPGTLPVVGEVAAGARDLAPVPPGAAVRIFTGAPVPAELDTIVIQEDAVRDGDRVVLPAAAAGAHVRGAGEDVAAGDAVVAAGTRVGAAELGLLAALGLAEVEVRRPPRVALIATGDELVPLGTPPGPGQLVDSSAHALAALVAETGASLDYLGIAPDAPDALAALLGRALAHDVVLTTGGVSVGDHDHVRAALAAAGVGLALWKVAMKPGKPVAFGRAGATAVFGLPGNPVSTFVAFELFVRPALLALQGATVTARPRAPVLLAGGYRKPAGRAHYLRARVTREGATLIAHPHARQGSGMLSSLVGCNALVEIPAPRTEVAPGDPVEAILLEAV